METKRKNLKWTSVVVLVFAALMLVNIAVRACFWWIKDVPLSSGIEPDMMNIAMATFLVISLALFLIQVYIGIKGLKIAKKPDSSKCHIVLAMILFVTGAIGLISPIVGIIRQIDVSDNISVLLSGLVEVTVFLEYVIYAKRVKKEI